MKLVLVRHGESSWNAENRFTGWTDVDLTARGVEEAHNAAQWLLEAGFTFDVAYTALLKRAIRTLWIMLDDMNLMWLPVHMDWRLNERHYGALQGLNKSETAAKYGEQQVLQWRRSYTVRPPAVSADDIRHPRFDRRYAGLSPAEIPVGESLKDTVDRFLPYWHGAIEPAIHSGKRVLIVAHGNTLRALIQYLDQLSEDDIIDLNIPTGIPLIYELNEQMQPLQHYYLGDPETVKQAAESVARQAEARVR